jgi:hypothetical protein
VPSLCLRQVTPPRVITSGIGTAATALKHQG